MSENIADEIILEKDAFETITETNDTDTQAAREQSVETMDNTKKDRPDLVEIGDALDALEVNDTLVQIAKTNLLDIPWEKLQRILDSLINEQCTVMEDKFQDEGAKKLVEALSTKISRAINDHSDCPFTIQRLCELVIEPKKYYKMYIKYLRATEKVLSVTSYWEDYANTPSADAAPLVDGEPQLLPSFSVELVPHNFESNVSMGEEKEEEKEESKEQEESIAPTTEEDTMDEVTKDEEVIENEGQDDMEHVTKEETVVEEVVAKEEVEESESKESEDNKEEEEEAKSSAKMDLD